MHRFIRYSHEEKQKTYLNVLFTSDHSVYLIFRKQNQTNDLIG